MKEYVSPGFMSATKEFYLALDMLDLNLKFAMGLITTVMAKQTST